MSPPRVARDADAEVGSQVIEGLQAGRSALPRGGQQLRVDVTRGVGQIRQGTSGNREQVDETQGRSHRAGVDVSATEVARRSCIAAEQCRIDIALEEPRLDRCSYDVSSGACVHDLPHRVMELGIDPPDGRWAGRWRRLPRPFQDAQDVTDIGNERLGGNQHLVRRRRMEERGDTRLEVVGTRSKAIHPPDALGQALIEVHLIRKGKALPRRGKHSQGVGARADDARPAEPCELRQLAYQVAVLAHGALEHSWGRGGLLELDDQGLQLIQMVDGLIGSCVDGPGIGDHCGSECPAASSAISESS